MKATNEKKAEGYSSPYDFEGRIPLSQAIPLGLQHVMAMFIGNLTPLIIVMGVCGLTADAGFGELRTALLQNAMIIAGGSMRRRYSCLWCDYGSLYCRRYFRECSRSIFETAS